jgi:hypothetical protein
MAPAGLDREPGGRAGDLAREGGVWASRLLQADIRSALPGCDGVTEAVRQKRQTCASARTGRSQASQRFHLGGNGNW